MHRNAILALAALTLVACAKPEEPKFSLSSFSQPDQTVGTAALLDQPIDPPVTDHGQIKFAALMDHLQKKGVQLRVNWPALATAKILPETPMYVHTVKQSPRATLAQALGNYPMSPLAFYEERGVVIVTSLEEFAQTQRSTVTYDLRNAKASLTAANSQGERETAGTPMNSVAAERLWRQLGSATVIGMTTPIYEFRKEPGDKLTITATPKVHAVVRELMGIGEPVAQR